MKPGPPTRSLAYLTAAVVLSALDAGSAFGAEGRRIERFPPPDFESGYDVPATTTPPPRRRFYDYLDVAALAAALAVSSYLALKGRSRKGLFVMGLVSLAYFGFWRGGCVCPVGATQNITLALFDPGYVVPVALMIFFLLPLVFTVLFGRTFCASVCPLGAVQDVFLVHAVKVPRWLEHGLGLLPYVYLGAAVLFAATGSAFVICRYDPFVSIFRLSGSLSMLVLGVCVLLVGMFVGRPYCRFFCPYGALLRQFSRVSKWHATITPDECIQCTLCGDACPFGAIREPNQDDAWRRRPLDLRRSVRRLGVLLALLPVLAGVGLWLGGHLGSPFSRVHSTVRLAERVRREETGPAAGALLTDKATADALEAFRKTGRPTGELYEEALALRARFVTGSRIFGAWLGLVIGLKLVSLSVKRTTTDYEPDRAVCLSCGRCFMNCPRERDRLKETDKVARGRSGPPSGGSDGE